MSDESNIAYQGERFKYYQLPKIQLDETGPAYTIMYEPHPYYLNQPLYWQKPAYSGNSLFNESVVEPLMPIEEAGNKLPATSQINMLPF